MKIIQLIQKPQHRGAEIFAVQLSEELIRMGYEVILVSIFEGDTQLKFSGRHIQMGRSLKHRLWDFASWRTFSKMVFKEKPDLVQANAGDTLKFAVFSRKLFAWKVPVVFRNASMMSQYISNSIVKNLNHFLLNEIDGIVSVSTASKEDMNRVFKLEQPKQQVIPIGVNPKISKLKHADSTRIDLVHIGGFTFEKNHLHLLDIFEVLLAKDSRFHLTLIGDGPLFGIVKAEILTRKLEKSVSVLGALKDPFSEISERSILVLPSKIEGLPGVILEAMLHRIPVIAYGVGGIPEILKNGETGWCITPEDKIAFVHGVQEIVSTEPFVRNEILEKAYSFVQYGYSLENIGRQFDEFYQSILNSSININLS